MAAVLAPDSPLVLIVHDEDKSELLNAFEADLLALLLVGLGELPLSVGIVAAHRAQRSLLQSRFPKFAAGIGTVEAMQEAEFDITLLSCTESDSEYISASGGFVHAPERLSMVVSRARLKSIVICSHTVLSAVGGELSPGFMAFQLLRQTCHCPLWSGNYEKKQVDIWGNRGF